ncbi:dephospho-CoA kinase [Akkermansiaceae bacterium]|nr:dephospho-CoA kinase [Akkermansiaceae bacterium]
MKSLRVFGLTGGIATGKSTAVSFFKELDPDVVVFDADACVKQLYQSDSVLNEIENHFGKEALIDGELNRDFLRTKLFHCEKSKKFLESLLHPRVRKECLALLEKAKQSSSATLFLADVPLLFEKSFGFGQELNLVVAVSTSTQILRLKKRNGFDDATVHAILEAQLPMDQKIDLADIVFWNDGQPEVLKMQIQRFLNDL